MGFIQLAYIQVKLLKPDCAFALTWWSVSFPGSQLKVVVGTPPSIFKSLIMAGRLWPLIRAQRQCDSLNLDFINCEAGLRINR
jgi:hypothetical protein